MSLLDVFKTEQQPFTRLFPGTGPCDTPPQRIDGFVEAILAPTLGVLAVAQMPGEIGEHARMKSALALRCGVKIAVEIARGASEVSPHLFGQGLHGLQALRQQHHVRLGGGDYGKGRV